MLYLRWVNGDFVLLSRLGNQIAFWTRAILEQGSSGCFKIEIPSTDYVDAPESNYRSFLVIRGPAKTVLQSMSSGLIMQRANYPLLCMFTGELITEEHVSLHKQAFIS